MVNLSATLLCAIVAQSTATAAVLHLQSDSEISTAGYFQLSWSNSTSHEVELQQSVHREFSSPHTLYRGLDASSVISGLANGQYYYRVREMNDDKWSNVVSVEVKHHPLSRAFAFFGLGAVMFCVTLFVLLKGARVC